MNVRKEADIELILNRANEQYPKSLYQLKRSANCKIRGSPAAVVRMKFPDDWFIPAHSG